MPQVFHIGVGDATQELTVDPAMARAGVIWTIADDHQPPPSGRACVDRQIDAFIRKLAGQDQIKVLLLIRRMKPLTSIGG